MTSAGETAEDRIILAAIPRIMLVCQGKWLNLEFEDRFAEALLLFIEKLRSEPLTSGHFFKDYLNLLTEYMDKLNRKTPSLQYGHFSLDASITGPKEDELNGHGILPSGLSDFSRLLAAEFISSLNNEERQIVYLRMYGYGKKEVSRALNMSVYQLEKTLSNIRHHYVDWASEG